jgi:uncharacterized protein YgfB (UPF0149 family)
MANTAHRRDLRHRRRPVARKAWALLVWIWTFALGIYLSQREAKRLAGELGDASRAELHMAPGSSVT